MRSRSSHSRGRLALICIRGAVLAVCVAAGCDRSGPAAATPTPSAPVGAAPVGAAPVEGSKGTRNVHEPELTLELGAGELSTSTPRTTLKITIRNRDERAWSYPLLDTIRFELVSEAGEAVTLEGGRNATRPGVTVSDPVPSGGTCLVSRTIGLESSGPGRVLRIDDGFGGSFFCKNPAPGVYTLRARLDGPASADAARWHGQTAWSPASLRIAP